MDAPPAHRASSPRISPIWFVPLITLLIAIWLAYDHWASQGPLIAISFSSAAGIEAGRTKVKMREVEVGAVADVSLAEKADHVMLSVRIEKDAAHLLREDSKFWVVRPQIGMGGISGLGTLMSGAYIELSPGSDKQSAYEFEGLESPPVTPIGVPGLHVTLDSDAGQTLSEGDPILFQGARAGSIEYVHFNTQERRTYYNAFIAAPYDRLVTSNTRFWFNSGVSVDLSADGVRLEIGTLQTLLGGGVAFTIPDGQPAGKRITKRAFFSIYPSESAINEKHYSHAIRYVILFNDSIRGLRPGAAVEYRGIKVGQVLRTDVDYPEMEHLLEPGSRIPVVIEIMPARLGFADSATVLPEVQRRMTELIDSGLRGGLATGNLLTGGKYIELQYDEGGSGPSQTFGDYAVIPSISGQLDQLLAGVEGTLDSINKLPLDAIAESARLAFNEVAATLNELRKSATELEDIMVSPATHQLTGTLNATLESFQHLARDFSEGSATNQELQGTLRSLEKTLEDLDPVLRQLRRRPNSLIFGGDTGEDIEPKGAKR